MELFLNLVVAQCKNMAINSVFKTYPELAEKLILNVDDNEMNQLVLGKIMKNAGIRTISANNGAEAVRKLNEGLRPDVILMDLEMPVMDGWQATEVIRDQINRNVPIIINSGAVTTNEKYKLKSIGANDFLEKPYSIKDILTKLSKNIRLVEAE